MPVMAGSRTSSVSDRVEDRLLVLLQVAVVGQREPLERGHQPGQVADQPAGLAARELGDVGVLLLRHDARPGRPRVVQRREVELPGRPEDDLLGEAGEVDADLGGDEGELGDEVARRVPSMELADEPVNPSSAATASGSRPSVWPARAPEPYGESLATRASQSRSRSTSRSSGHAWASRWCDRSTGWACWRCVRPGITISSGARCSRACPASTSTRSSTRPAIVCAWSRR